VVVKDLHPSEIDLAKALALLKASPTVNQHEFENVSQLVLRKIADKDNLSICPTRTRGIWQVAFPGRYLGTFDNQGNDLHNENSGGWSGKCPLNSNELK